MKGGPFEAALLCCCGEDEIPLRCACAISFLPVGSLQRLQLTAFGRMDCFHMSPYESKLSTAPYENSPALRR